MAPFLLAADPFSKQTSISQGHVLKEKTPQVAGVDTNYEAINLDDHEQGRSISSNIEHFSFVPWQPKSYSVGDDKPMGERTTQTTTTTILSQTIHISTTQITTVPVHGDPSRSTIFVGPQHPTTDLEDRYLLLVEKLATKIYKAKNAHGPSPEPRNLAQRIWEKIRRVTVYVPH